MKTDYNIAENCMDSFYQTLRDYLPEGNHVPHSYYETKDMLKEFAMPYERIDVCKNSYMLYWGDDVQSSQCKFCGENRFCPRRSTSHKSVPYKKMFYMPIAPRLKRLYELDRTSSHMRWHARHSTTTGEMQHPSDGKAWKDFSKVFLDFLPNLEEFIFVYARTGLVHMDNRVVNTLYGR